MSPVLCIYLFIICVYWVCAQVYISDWPRVHTGRIGSRQQLAGGVPWVCSGGTQRSYGDHLHPIRLRFHGKPLFWKIGWFILRHVDMWWFCLMWPKCAFGDQKGLIRNKDMPFGNSPHHGTKNCGLLKNVDFFIFCLLWVKKWCFGSKNGGFWVFGPGVR